MTSVTRRPKPPEGSRTYGVDPEAAERALRAYLYNEKGQQRPYCVCSSIRGWVFDVQVGVYLHSDPACWKPSKAYYEAALRAGILGEPVIR